MIHGNKTQLSRLANIDAERTVIGSVIDDPSLLGWIDITEKHFTLPANIRIWRAIEALENDDKTIDGITVAEAAGLGYAEVSEYWYPISVTGAIEAWVEILEEKRRMRVIVDVLARATREINLSADDSGDVCNQILSGLMAIESGNLQDGRWLSEAIEEEFAQLEIAASGGEGGARMATGIDLLDENLGGLPIGTPTIVGARPGVGKSTFIWNLCRHQSRQGRAAIILTNEDKDNVSARLAIANAVSIARRRIMARDLTHDQITKVREMKRQIQEEMSKIYVLSIHGKKMRQIVREATGIIRRNDATLVVLDYVQNVANPEPGMARNYGIEENMRMLEDMIAREKVAGIVVSQLKRPKEPGSRPMLSDFKDSGSIEQKGKLIIGLHIAKAGGQQDRDQATDSLEVCVLKNSEGTSQTIIKLDFESAFGRISSPPEQQQWAESF